MVSLIEPELEHHSQATDIGPANQPSKVSRSRSQRQTMPLSNSGFLGHRIDRPLYLNVNEFSGGPGITMNKKNGTNRLAEEDDCGKGHITASQSRGSEDESSVHKISDLGFEAAATSCSELFQTLSGCDSVIPDPLEAVFEERKFRRCSQDQKPLEPTSTLANITKEIESAFEWSQFDREEFLPLDAFESIFNEKTIALLLDETYEFATLEELKNKFASIVDRRSGKSRRRILGVLVMMSQVAHIEYFIREGIWDDELPLERSTGSTKWCVRTRSSENDKLMESWERKDIELFRTFQKMFFIPFFDIQDHRLCSYELESNIRLPWKVFQHKTNGGFGVVHKVEIHPSHHNFVGSNSSVKPVFALKTIEAGDHKAYKDELAALEKTCAQIQREKHLIKLLLTFRHGDKFFLLFEWADGNLGEFWETYNIRPPTLLDERWAAKQCLGLARAVSRIHGLTTGQKNGRSTHLGSLDDAERDWGRHGDIKPENILWFQEYGTDHNLLVISDLGLTRYHSQSSKSFVSRSRIDGCSWAYRAPELDIEERISQKYDIWSLGCVFLEFVVWYLQGYDEVGAFSLQRVDGDLVTYEGVQVDKFFNIEKSQDGQRIPKVKQVVKDRLKELKDLSMDSTFARELLYVIELKMLQCAPEKREKIDVICADLSIILQSIIKAESPNIPAQGLSPDHSQDLAYIRRGDSAPSLRAPRNISLYEEVLDPATDDENILTGDGSDPGLLMRTNSQRLRRENGTQSESLRSPAPSTDGPSAVAEKTRTEKIDHFPEAILESDQRGATREDAASSNVPGRPPPTTETNKTRNQRSKKWFREPLARIKRIWRG